MGSLRLRVLAASALALVGAAPAAAVTGAGFSHALRSGNAVTIAIRTTRTSKNQTCQAQNRKSTAKAALLGNAHKFAVVACEQPPRSQLVTPTMLKQATASALATLG
jgi:hypothetical protein